MRALSGVAAGTANRGGESLCGETRNILRTNQVVMQKARDLFPTKTVLHLIEITGYSQRTVEYWLQGKTRLPADALASLLQSEWGREFLDAVMDGQRPAWWMQALAFFGLADASELQRKARRKIRAVLYADANLDAGTIKGEAAALRQDAEYFGEVFAPHRAALLPQNRPVAIKRGR